MKEYRTQLLENPRYPGGVYEIYEEAGDSQPVTVVYKGLDASQGSRQEGKKIVISELEEN